eukprot:366239-Chlamydomonas_euryale.AAC.26
MQLPFVCLVSHLQCWNFGDFGSFVAALPLTSSLTAPTSFLALEQVKCCVCRIPACEGQSGCFEYNIRIYGRVAAALQRLPTPFCPFSLLEVLGAAQPCVSPSHVMLRWMTADVCPFCFWHPFRLP